MAAWSETFLAPIMARMAEQETTIRDQAETIGTLRAELTAPQPQNATLDAPRSTETPEPTTGAYPALRETCAADVG